MFWLEMLDICHLLLCIIDFTHAIFEADFYIYVGSIVDSKIQLQFKTT